MSSLGLTWTSRNIRVNALSHIVTYSGPGRCGRKGSVLRYSPRDNVGEGENLSLLLQVLRGFWKPGRVRSESVLILNSAQTYQLHTFVWSRLTVPGSVFLLN